MDRINCMREDPSDPTSRFHPGKLGVYTAGVQFQRFADMFRAAYPEAEWQQQYDGFKRAVQMPISGLGMMSEDEFNLVVDWTNRGMPFMERLVGNVPDAPRQCTESFSPELRAHIERMRLEGWEAKNRENGIMMFGCPDGGDKLACFTQQREGSDVFPEARSTAVGAEWHRDFPEATTRILRELPFDTSYWMRTSADGRFVANGAYDDDDGDDVYFGGRVSDLQNQLIPGAGLRDIKVAASFDPSFMPDNTGFMFQGTPVGAGFCKQSILTNPATTEINWSEPGCSGSGDINLYQALGASLDGSDYVAVTGSFESDGGSGRGGGDGAPSWMERAYANFTSIINDGDRFVTRTPAQLFTPYLGDWQISPSNVLMSSRVAGLGVDDQPVQQGFKFHMLSRTMTPNGYAYEMREVGSLCLKGGKTGFSYDDRMFTTYHYVDVGDWQELDYPSADDPAFLDLLNSGSANVYVVDLYTGARRRVTRMGPGQYAMFPHYRSDGWLYYMVYEETLGQRFVVASDASLRIAAATDAANDPVRQ
jgi:hypothetical protein